MAKGSNLSLSPPKESQESTIPTPAPAVSSLLSTEDSDTSSGQLLWALHLKHTQSTGQGAKIQNVLGTLKYPEGAGHRNTQSDLDTEISRVTWTLWAWAPWSIRVCSQRILTPNFHSCLQTHHQSWEFSGRWQIEELLATGSFIWK